MDGTKQIVILSASPKVKQENAVSELLTKRGAMLLTGEQIETREINVRRTLLHKETQEAFHFVSNADAVVLVFPLYFFCMPAVLTRFLQDFATAYPKSAHPSRVYAIVNCGFPEPEINREAMRVVERFAVQTERIFCGGVMIGCGPMVLGAQGAPFMRPVMDAVDLLFSRVKRDALSETPEPTQINSVFVKFPKKLYFIAGNAGWHSMARKNRLVKADLRRKPYEE